MSGWGLRALFAPGTVASRTANIASRWILNLMNLKTNSSRRCLACITSKVPYENCAFLLRCLPDILRRLKG